MEVRLPDGRVANFPDTMPRGEVRAIVGWMFPDAGIKYDPNDLLWAQIRKQREAQNAGRAQPQTEGNPAASSLPGILGQFQDMSSAFQRGAMEGMTGNLSDEIFAGVVAPVDAAIRAALGQGFNVGQSFGDIYQGSSDIRQQQMALNPQAAGTGNVAGALVLGKSLGGLSPMGRASTPLGMAALGALEGAAYGGLYGIGGAEGNIGERAIAALPEAGMGALVGGGLGYGVGALGPRISQEARALNRGFQADRIDPASVAARVAAIDPSAVIADIGPNLQGQAAALATLPGPASRVVNDALTARRLMANERVRTGVSDILGEPPVLSKVASEIDDARKAVNEEYEPLFLQKALSDDPYTDVSSIVSALDTHIKRTTGPSKATLEQIRGLLVDANGTPINDPRILLSIRHDLDGLRKESMNNTLKGILGEYRKQLDEVLGTSVPGLKEVDAKFQEIAGQGEALEQGRAILDTGRNTAIDPADLIEQMKGASEGQNFRLSQGARAEINRIIGTKANDRVALQGIIKGDGSWNEQKLRAVFGEEKANRLMSLVDSEATMAATENLATSGSRTQVLKAAQEDFAIRPNPSIMREALNFQYGNAAARMADAILGGSIAARREGVNSNVARALMARDLSPQMQQEIARINFGMSYGTSIDDAGNFILGKDAISAALASGAANSANERREPLRIVIQGAGSYGGQ